MANDVVLIGTTLIYLIIGIGTTRVIAKLKAREISIFEIFFWPLALSIFAFFGDVS